MNPRSTEKGRQIMSIDQKAERNIASDATARFEFIKKTGQPTENHKRLAATFEGEWEYTTKWYPEPGGKPVESKGTSRIKPLYGGRVLQWTDDGTLLGEKVQSMGLIGYDFPQMKMFRTQYNSYSTAFVVARGEWPEGSNEIRLNADHHIDTLTGARDSGGARLSIAIEGPNTHIVRVFEWTPDAKEYVASESVYTRR
jgi:hypothetical protein